MLACTLATAEKLCEQVTVAVAPLAPYITQASKGQWGGPYVGALESFAQNANIKLIWAAVDSSAAAAREARDGRADLWLAAPYDVNRLEQFDYVYPALPGDELAVWIKDAQLAYAGWNDLRGLRGWSYSLSNTQGRFAGFAQANLELDTHLDSDAAFKALQDGTLEYVVYPAKAATLLDQALLEGLFLHSLGVPLQPLHVAVSHNSACNDAWLRGQLAKHMAGAAHAFEAAKP